MIHVASHSRIRVLPSLVANQIAAGEVVERPASVVKELLENSLDAGARSIEVEIEQGGVQRIRIRDDGHGIHHDDLILALSPHATSKIATAEDLDGVISLGFRGEALASIASVSLLTLSSRCVGEESGWRINGSGQEATPIPLPVGTEVDVRDLFYNTPARRKFLRSERTELSHVEEVIRRIALSRFDLALRFSHNGKQMLRLKQASPGNEGIRRVSDVLGGAFVENSVAVDVTADGLRIWGWIGHDGYSRSQADIHYFYLNGRMIRDRLASHAVRLAFGERTPEGRFPAYLLYLELDPRLVDVNVHPTKHEVRFREARHIHDFIYWAVKRALDEDVGVRGASVIRYESAPQADESYRTPLRTAVREPSGHYAAYAGLTATLVKESDAPLGRAVCQLHNGYLLAERGDMTVVIDLRSMMAELHYIHLSSSSGDALLTTQPLLLPESLNLTAEDACLWRDRGAVLQTFGFEFGWLGEELLVLRKVPAIVRSASMPSLLQAVQAWLGRLDDSAEGVKDDLLRTLASHAVPKQLPAYSLSDLNALLREYEAALPNSTNRPWRELHAADWQRFFESIS